MRFLLASFVVGMAALSALAQGRPLPRAGQGVPGSTVIAPVRHFGPYGGNNYFINNGNNSSYGNNSYGFTGTTTSFYTILGGPAPSSPFVNNTIPFHQNWPNNGATPFGQQQGLPFPVHNFNNQSQMPAFNNAPVVGQANGFFPNQPPAAPGLNNNNNLQMFPGINGFGNR
ncbi:MAG: hypothetical protein WCL32_12965 [Planctomycetota bacterium]